MVFALVDDPNVMTAKATRLIAIPQDHHKLLSFFAVHGIADKYVRHLAAAVFRCSRP